MESGEGHVVYYRIDHCTIDFAYNSLMAMKRQFDNAKLMIKDDNKMARQCNDDGAMAQLSDCAMTRWYESDNVVVRQR